MCFLIKIAFIKQPNVLVKGLHVTKVYEQHLQSLVCSIIDKLQLLIQHNHKQKPFTDGHAPCKKINSMKNILHLSFHLLSKHACANSRSLQQEAVKSLQLLSRGVARIRKKLKFHATLLSSNWQQTTIFALTYYPEANTDSTV